MAQSGGISFFYVDPDTGERTVYSVTVFWNPEDGPAIWDSNGVTYVPEEGD